MQVVRDVSAPPRRGQGPRRYAYVTVTYETVGCTASGQTFASSAMKRVPVLWPPTYPRKAAPCLATRVAARVPAGRLLPATLVAARRTTPADRRLGVRGHGCLDGPEAVWRSRQPPGLALEPTFPAPRGGLEPPTQTPKDCVLPVTPSGKGKGSSHEATVIRAARPRAARLEFGRARLGGRRCWRRPGGVPEFVGRSGRAVHRASTTAQAGRAQVTGRYPANVGTPTSCLRPALRREGATAVSAAILATARSRAE
jgi:hypothetical protein